MMIHSPRVLWSYGLLNQVGTKHCMRPLLTDGNVGVIDLGNGGGTGAGRQATHSGTQSSGVRGRASSKDEDDYWD